MAQPQEVWRGYVRVEGRGRQCAKITLDARAIYELIQRAQLNQSGKTKMALGLIEVEILDEQPEMLPNFFLEGMQEELNIISFAPRRAS